MLLARLTVVIAAMMSAGSALAGPVVLYDGNATPETEGWTRNAGGAGSEIVGAGTTEFVTVNDPNGFSSQISTYAFATGATDFVVAIQLQVLSSSSNPLDAGLAFSPFGSLGPGFIQNDRYNSVMIDVGRLTFGDETQSTSVANSSGFHSYALRYVGGTLSVYFDADFDSVVAGTAPLQTLRLQRAIEPHAGSTVGTIVFGDATNDPNYNSDYIVDSVTFQNLAVADVPEPGTMALLAAGAGALGLARGRRWLTGSRRA